MLLLSWKLWQFSTVCFITVQTECKVLNIMLYLYFGLYKNNIVQGRVLQVQRSLWGNILSLSAPLILLDIKHVTHAGKIFAFHNGVIVIFTVKGFSLQKFVHQGLLGHKKKIWFYM